jgi:hypothetical protein
MRSFCDQVSRRQFLRVGAAPAVGLSLAEMLRLQAVAGTPGARQKSVIVLYQQGGPATMDMWDLKPDAPAEFRGDFAPIRTNVSGIEISEHLPLSAKQADKFALLRSVNHPNAGHRQGQHYMLTSYLPGPGFNADLVPNNQFPCMGSIVAKELGGADSLPSYISIPSLTRSGGASFLGPAYAPFVITSDPAAPDFSVRDIDPPRGVDDERLFDRKRLLATVDTLQKQAESASAAGSRVESMSTFYEKAYNLVTSPAAKQAFDLASESRDTRAGYGMNSLGQSCLLARRLVEAGARFIQIDHGSWDTHTENFASLRKNLLPVFDRAFATLLQDLSDRGLLESTLIVVVGEFARTPRINKNAGRDHWPNAMTVVLAGGGLRTGQVLGESDARAMYPKTDPIAPQEVVATIYHQLGIDLGKIYHSPLGRPLPIANSGRPLEALV